MLKHKLILYYILIILDNAATVYAFITMKCATRFMYVYGNILHAVYRTRLPTIVAEITYLMTGSNSLCAKS